MKFNIAKQNRAMLAFGPLCGLVMLNIVGCAGTSGGPASYSATGHIRAKTSAVNTGTNVTAGDASIAISPTVTTAGDADGLKAFIPSPFIPSGGSIANGAQLGVLKKDSSFLYGDYSNAKLTITNTSTNATKIYALNNNPALFSDAGTISQNIAFPNGALSLSFSDIKVAGTQSIAVGELKLVGTVASGVLPFPHRIGAILPQDNQALENATMNLWFGKTSTLNGHTVALSIVGDKASVNPSPVTISAGKANFPTLGDAKTILGKIVSLTITVN